METMHIPSVPPKQLDSISKAKVTGLEHILISIEDSHSTEALFFFRKAFWRRNHIHLFELLFFIIKKNEFNYHWLSTTSKKAWWFCYIFYMFLRHHHKVYTPHTFPLLLYFNILKITSGNICCSYLTGAQNFILQILQNFPHLISEVNPIDTRIIICKIR